VRWRGQRTLRSSSPEPSPSFDVSRYTWCRRLHHWCWKWCVVPFSSCFHSHGLQLTSSWCGMSLGIGAAIALSLAQSGCSLFLVARTLEVRNSRFPPSHSPCLSLSDSQTLYCLHRNSRQSNLPSSPSYPRPRSEFRTLTSATRIYWLKLLLIA